METRWDGMKVQNGLSRRDTALIATFGALWGLMEITVGVTLKGLRIPMGGAILTALAVIIFTTGRYFVPRKGSVLMMGTVAAILKIFSVGTVIAGPFMAIVLEALFGEILLSLLGRHLLSYILTGVILLLYSMVHPFISQGIVFGANIYKIYLDSFTRVAELLHIPARHLLWIIAFYAGVHALLGATAGWIGYLLPRRAEYEYAQLKQNSGEQL